MGQMSAKEALRMIELYQALGVESLPLPEIKTAKGKNTRRKVVLAKTEKESALRGVRELMGECTRCKLSSGRTNIVFGEGNPGAEIMFIGEAPGREEDLQARPFVGDAGKLLTSLIEKMGFGREEVYIANICKCRPPMNRDPEEDEIAACIPFLKSQLEIISPRAIMALGRVSAQTLLKSAVQISRLRGRFHEYEGIPLMPTFHPAYLLRSRSEKVKTWEDALKVLDLLGKKPA
jgi:DNA polymerase